MTMRTKRAALFFIALSVLIMQGIPFCSEGFSDDTDVIHFKRGKGVNSSDTLPATGSGMTIRVVKETLHDVVVKHGSGAEITFPRDTVESIDYYDAPNEYRRARAALRDGKPARALEHLERVGTAGKRRWIAVHRHFYTAQAHLILGETDRKKNETALRLFEEFSTKYLDTPFTWDALTGQVAALFQMQDYAGALARLRTLETRSRVGTRGRHLIELWRAKVYELGTKDYEKARMVYARLVRTAGFAFPDISATAKVGELRCLALTGRYQEALLGARRLTGRNGTKNPVVLAYAWSVIGDCHLAAGNGPAKSNDAVLAYLRVVIVYDGDAVLTARAAYKAAECFEKTERMDRAAALYRRASRMKGGEWSRKAAERLKEIG